MNIKIKVINFSFASMRMPSVTAIHNEDTDEITLPEINVKQDDDFDKLVEGWYKKYFGNNINLNFSQFKTSFTNDGVVIYYLGYLDFMSLIRAEWDDEEQFPYVFVQFRWNRDLIKLTYTDEEKNKINPKTGKKVRLPKTAWSDYELVYEQFKRPLTENSLSHVRFVNKEDINKKDFEMLTAAREHVHELEMMGTGAIFNLLPLRRTIPDIRDYINSFNSEYDDVRTASLIRKYKKYITGLGIFEEQTTRPAEIFRRIDIESPLIKK